MLCCLQSLPPGPSLQAGGCPGARQVTSRSAGLKAERARRQADYHLQGDDSWSMSGKKILLLPTVVINGNQYRGRLEVPAITRALCAGFSETSEPSVRGAPPAHVPGRVGRPLRQAQRPSRTCSCCSPQSSHHKLLSCMSSRPSCMSDRVRHNPASEAKWAHLNAQDSAQAAGGGRVPSACSGIAAARRHGAGAGWRRTAQWCLIQGRPRAGVPGGRPGGQRVPGRVARLLVARQRQRVRGHLPRLRLPVPRGCASQDRGVAASHLRGRRRGPAHVMHYTGPGACVGRPVPAPSRRALRRAPCQPGHGWDHARPCPSLHAP